MGFSIPSSARLPTPKELESQTGFQTYLTKTFAADEELLSELQVLTQGLQFDSYGVFFEFLDDEGFTIPQAWTGRAGGSGLYMDPAEYYKKIAPGSAKPASSSTKKSVPKSTYADRAEELRATKPEIYEHYMELDPFEKAGDIDAELLEIMADPQAFSDYVAVQGLQDAFSQAVSGVVEVTSIEEFYDALYGKYDASGSPLMTYEEQVDFKTTEGAYNHLKAYEENLYQKGLDHVDSLLTRGDSGASNLNIKLFAVYLEAYLENPQNSMASFRALEEVLAHWNNPVGSEGRENVAVLTGFYHGIMKNLSYAQTDELRKLYLSEGGFKSPEQNPLLVGKIPKPLLDAISRIQKSVPVQMSGGFTQEVAEGKRDHSLLSALAWIDSRASYAEGPRKLFEDARELIAETLEDSQDDTNPSGIYDRITHFPEGPARDKVYAEIGIKKEWVEKIYDDLKWRVPKGSKDLLHFYEKDKRPADCPVPSWDIACDIAYSQFNCMLEDAALMAGRFVCIIGLAVVGGMTGGVGGAIVAAGVGGSVGGALDVHDMAVNLERAQVNYYSDVDETGVGSYQHVELAQREVDYATFCAAASTVASMATAGGTVAVSEALKQVGMKGLALAMGNVALNGTVGMADGTIMALTDGRIMDVAHNQEKLQLAGDEAGAEGYTPITGIILSATLGGVIGGGFSTGGEALGGALKFLKTQKIFHIKVDSDGDPARPPRISILAPDGTEVPVARVVELDESTGHAVLELEDGTLIEGDDIDLSEYADDVDMAATPRRSDSDEVTEEIPVRDSDDTESMAVSRKRDDEEGLDEPIYDDDPDDIDLSRGTYDEPTRERVYHDFLAGERVRGLSPDQAAHNARILASGVSDASPGAARVMSIDDAKLVAARLAEAKASVPPNPDHIAALIAANDGIMIADTSIPSVSADYAASKTRIADGFVNPHEGQRTVDHHGPYAKNPDGSVDPRNSTMKLIDIMEEVLVSCDGNIDVAIAKLNLRAATTDNLADGGWCVWVAKNQRRVLENPQLRALIRQATSFEDFTAFGSTYYAGQRGTPGIELQAAIFGEYNAIIKKYELKFFDRFSPAQAEAILNDACAAINKMLDPASVKSGMRRKAAEAFWTGLDAARDQARTKAFMPDVSVAGKVSVYDNTQLKGIDTLTKALAVPLAHNSSLQVTVSPMTDASGALTGKTLYFVAIPDGRKLPSGKDLLTIVGALNRAEMEKATRLGMTPIENVWGDSKSNVAFPKASSGGSVLTPAEISKILTDPAAGLFDVPTGETHAMATALDEVTEAIDDLGRFLESDSDVEHTIPSAPRPVVAEPPVVREGTAPRGMPQVRPSTATPGRNRAVRDIEGIEDVASLGAYTNKLIARARSTRETGEIPKDVVLADFANADGPVTSTDYTFVADTLETRLNQLASDATDEVTAVMRQIDELRFLAQNREMPKPAAVKPATKPVSPAPLPEATAQVLNAGNYTGVNEALEILVPILSARVKDGKPITQSTYEVYQVKLTALEKIIRGLEETGVDVKSLRENLAVCREKLQQFQVVPDETPLAPPSAVPRADQPQSDHVVPVKRRDTLPPE